MASQKQQYTILYGRLSQEDERAGESNSILHQRELLESYAQAKGFENTLFLADDGYSGTNFDRPSWKKIIEMIEAGEVSSLSSIICSQREQASWSSMILNDEVSANAILKRATKHYTVVIKPLMTT